MRKSPFFQNVFSYSFRIGLFAVVIGDSLPFKCPYKIPEGSPKPTINIEENTQGGMNPQLYFDGALDEVSSNDYAKYRASLALVPCDAKAISVFTENKLGTNSAISVIFVYNKPVEDLKAWLR